MTGFRSASLLSMIVGDGCQCDPGGRGRDDGDLSVLRRRDPFRARPARAPQARLCGLHGPPRPRAVHPSHRRCPRRRRLQPALQPGAAARRRVLLAHGRGPRRRACAATSGGTTSTAGSRCSSGRGRAPTWVCRWSSRTGRASVRSPPSRKQRNAFTAADEQLFIMLARVLASELERESNARDLRRFNDMLRDQAKGMGAIGRVAKALAAGDDARQSICEAACEVMDAPVAFLLEPKGRDFSSTAMSGVSVQPVTIQPRGDGPGGGKAFTAKEAYFVADARNHPALAAPLVEATSARSAVFEPILRDGEVCRRPDRHLAASARRHPRGGRRCAAARRGAGRDRDRARGPAGARRGAGADRSADRPGHQAGLRGGAAARDRARPPLGVAVVDRLDRPRPHERVQHAARRGRGRPPGQGDRGALAWRAARRRLGRAPGRRRVRA